MLRMNMIPSSIAYDLKSKAGSLPSTTTAAGRGSTRPLPSIVMTTVDGRQREGFISSNAGGTKLSNSEQNSIWRYGSGDAGSW